MAKKVWHKTIIATEEQNITVSPTPDYDGIVIETQELDDTGSSRLYLNRAEMELLISKMREMMDHVEKP